MVRKDKSEADSPLSDSPSGSGTLADATTVALTRRVRRRHDERR